MRALRRIYWRFVRRHEGEICQACGRPVDRSTGRLSYWFAQDALWDRVEGGQGGIRCIPCFTADCHAAGVNVAWTPDASLRAVLDAFQPLIAAYRHSSQGRITEEQVTAAWAAYDEARRAVS
jgi:hypothetical protein